MLGLAIRYGHLEDADAIVELIGREQIVGSESEVASLLSRGSFLVLDREKGGLAASIYVEIRDGRGEVGMLSVAADLDGDQLSQRLIEVAEMVCVAEGCEALELSLEDSEAPPALSRLSQSMGYRPVQPVDAGETGVRLEKRLA